jgi:hypothetical protein
VIGAPLAFEMMEGWWWLVVGKMSPPLMFEATEGWWWMVVDKLRPPSHLRRWRGSGGWWWAR